MTARALVAAALLLAAAPPAAAQTAAAAEASAVLREGTRVQMRTLAPLSSRRTRQGQRFDLEVAEEVRVDGRLVIPKGARGVGEISRVLPKGMMGRSGKIEVRVLFVEVGGHRIRLDGSARDRGKSGAGPVAIAYPLVGVGAAFFTGTSALIPAGSPVEGVVAHDVKLAPPPAGAE
jgi:hypothetical protein